MSAPSPHLPQWHALVVARIAAERGGILGLEVHTTRPRFRLLSDACFKGDVQYVILHQSYCLWSLDTAAAFSRFSCTAAEVDAAFRAVQSLLKPNDGIMLEHMRWFASFPATPSAEGINAATLQNIKHDIIDFLRAFPLHWPEYKVRCQARRYPITASEVMKQLKCRSVIFQDLISP